MAIDEKFVLRALLKYNYFPTQKKDRSELPPSFSERKFTPRAAKLILKNSVHRKKGMGWDAISYRSTRFTGVPRMLSIPHPVPHALLSILIADNWKELEYTAKNKLSEIRPRKHRDGRLIIMDYEGSSAKFWRQHHLSFARRFRVHTDITNCFPGIYTHSIPWATVGFVYSKSQKNNKTAWFNELDERVRWCKRNETNGIAIGPATSNVVMESILAKVDKKMSVDHGFTFVRYIDDYVAYCDTEADAQRFIRLLGAELDNFKLLLNIKKTKIDQLPESFVSSWVSQLSLLFPKNKLLNVFDVAHYLSAAQYLAKEEPDGSVIKYAVVSLLRASLKPNARDFILGELILLSYHYPIIVPLLRKPLRWAKSSNIFLQFADYDERLNRLLEHHAYYHRSDAMCWLLFFLAKMQYPVSDEACNRILESRDCLALLSLYKTGSPSQKDLVKDFASKLDKNEFYELDVYWLLLYEMFKDGEIKNPYGNQETAFDAMKKMKLTFYFETAKL